MKKRVQLALAGVGVGMVSLVAVTHSATAQVVSFAKTAKGFSSGTFMVRAMDECNPASIAVLTPGSPSAGCLQSNGDTTDNTLGMRFMKLSVNQRGRIVMFGTGFKLGDELRLRLTLRVTKEGVNTAAGPQTVTFPDMTVDCPKAPDAFNARPNGAVIGSTLIRECISPNIGMVGPHTNIEIVDFPQHVVNVLNGKAVASFGILAP